VVIKSSVFWHITLFSPLEADPFEGTFRLYIQGNRNKQLLDIFLSHFSTLKMEAIISSETIWHCLKEDRRQSGHFRQTIFLSKNAWKNSLS
jgi:hypothetical protein